MLPIFVTELYIHVLSHTYINFHTSLENLLVKFQVIGNVKSDNKGLQKFIGCVYQGKLQVL